MTINRLPRRSFLALAAGSLAAPMFSFDASAVSAQVTEGRPSLGCVHELTLRPAAVGWQPLVLRPNTLRPAPPSQP